MKAIDTHAHLEFPQYDHDRDELIAGLESDEVGVITIATDEQSIPKIVELTKNPLIWGTVGLHPSDLTPGHLTTIPQRLIEWTKILEENHKIVALGEIGLDYFHHQPDGTASIQQSVLKQLLSFAQEKNLPIIVHCREAYGDMVTILSEYPGIKGVIHCYNGSREQLARFLGLGFYISFTGMLTYPANTALREMSVDVPLERLLLETDSPFLSPQSNRGKRNDPNGIFEIAKQHGELRSCSIEEILGETTKNATTLFGIA